MSLCAADPDCQGARCQGPAKWTRLAHPYSPSLPRAHGSMHFAGGTMRFMRARPGLGGARVGRALLCLPRLNSVLRNLERARTFAARAPRFCVARRASASPHPSRRRSAGCLHLVSRSLSPKPRHGRRQQRHAAAAAADPARRRGARPQGALQAHGPDPQPHPRQQGARLSDCQLRRQGGCWRAAVGFCSYVAADSARGPSQLLARQSCDTR